MTLTAKPAAHGALAWELETDAAHWGEDVETFANRLPHIGLVDPGGLVHNKEEPGHAEQRRGAGGPFVRMAKGGSFKVLLDLPGHGSTTEGSPGAANAIITFLAWMIGMENGPDLSLATSMTLTGGTASDPTASAANGVDAGGMVAIGELGDGDGDGQIYSVKGHAGSVLDLENNLRGAPVAGAKVFPLYMVYPPSDPTVGQIRGSRWLLTTANMEYSCHGCFPMGLVFRAVGPNGRPQFEATIGVSRWDEVEGNFPLAGAHNKLLPAPVASGSLHVNEVSSTGVVTTTRNDLLCSDFTIDYDMRVEISYGPPHAAALNVDPEMAINGACRLVDGLKVTFVVDADENTDSPVLPGWGRDRTKSFFIVYTLSPTPGTRVGFKFPKVCSRTVPVQQAINNLNRFRFEGEAYTSDTETSELTSARMVGAFG